MKVLSLGLPRTGSASIAKALTILGYDNVCHGVDIVDKNPGLIELFARAADASFPVLPSYRGTDFTLEEWEEIYHDCEASTDVAGMFATQLIKCYPNAKVILVIRPFDQWYESLNDGVFKYLFGWPADFYCSFLEPLFGSQYLGGCRKIVLGMFNARNVHEIRSNARSLYDRQHAQIRKMKDPSELLIFDLKTGWGPLCEFLQKPVPDVPFPRINERAAIQAKIVEIINRDAKRAAKKSFPWLFALVVIGFAMYMRLTTYSELTNLDILNNVFLNSTRNGFQTGSITKIFQ